MSKLSSPIKSKRVKIIILAFLLFSFSFQINQTLGNVKVPIPNSKVIVDTAGNKWWMPDVEVKKLEDIIKPMESRAKETLSGVKKAINLPAWSKLTLKLDADGTPHIFSGHRKGGNRLAQSIKDGGQKDVFPDWMTEKQILDSTKEAYNNAKKVGTQVDGITGEKRVELLGKSKDGMKIRMYVNVTTKELESAFPQWK